MSITIKRMNHPMSLNLDFKVFLDDDLILNIHDGEMIKLDIPAGKHKIFIEVDEVISKKVKFELMDYEEINFVCGLKMPSVGNILSSLIDSFRPSKYSYIEIEKSMG